MKIKKILTAGITTAIAVSSVAVAAISTVNGYDNSYKSGYSYTYNGNSYAKMNYYEDGNFVQTKATNKKSISLYPELFVYVYDAHGRIVDSSSAYRTLKGKGTIGINGCYNYRSTSGRSYKHKVVVYKNSTHTNKVATMSKTVG